MIRITTVDVRDSKGTKKISQFHDNQDILIVESELKSRFPQLLKIAPGRGRRFLAQIETLRAYCKKRNGLFKISIGARGLGEEPSEHLYIDPFALDNRVLDVALYLNKKDEVNAYSALARPRFYAYGGEPPWAIEKKPIEEFQEGLDFLLKELKESEKSHG